MARKTKRTKSDQPVSDRPSSEVSEPQTVYARKAPRRHAPKQPKRSGYDAKRSAGMLPGIAERMKEYLKAMRDDR
jgi:hypothetical protein